MGAHQSTQTSDGMKKKERKTKKSKEIRKLTKKMFESGKHVRK